MPADHDICTVNTDDVTKHLSNPTNPAHPVHPLHPLTPSNPDLLVPLGPGGEANQGPFMPPPGTEPNPPPIDFTLTAEVLQRIFESAVRCGMALKADITDAFPDNPDRALAVAIGFGVATTLNAFSEPTEKATMVDGINILVRRMGYALRPTN